MKPHSFQDIAIAAAAFAAGSSVAVGSVLTFDITPISNFQNVPDNYGDHVTATTMGNFSYGADFGFTPNIEVSYTRGPADPALWTTGYGDLVNILFEDADGVGQLEVVFTADAGYNARLHSWDMSAFSSAFSADPTINSVTVLDGAGAELFRLDNAVISESTHTTFEFLTPLEAPVLRLRFDSANLGTLSDDIAFDNIAFSQSLVPAPAAGALLIIAGGMTLRRRR